MIDSIIKNSEHNKHKEKLVIALLSILMLFFCTFVVALIALKTNHALFNIGIPASIETWLIIILSVVFMLKIIYELIII